MVGVPRTTVKYILHSALATFICPVLSWLERIIATKNPIAIPTSTANNEIIRVFPNPCKIYLYRPSSIKLSLKSSINACKIFPPSHLFCSYDDYLFCLCIGIRKVNVLKSVFCYSHSCYANICFSRLYCIDNCIKIHIYNFKFHS